MTLRAWLQWLLFVGYVGLFFAIPLTLLWERVGGLVGLGAAAIFLISLRIGGNRRIQRRLKMKRLTRAEVPLLASIVSEYCRRLSIPVPQLGVLETPALNSAVFGFSRHQASLVVTRGALTTLTRAELSSLVARELVYLWEGDIVCDSWLSQFLSGLDRIAGPGRSRSVGQNRRYYPFRRILRQVLIYPLILFPVYVLRSARRPIEMDLKTVKLTRQPQPLAEALRHLEASQERLPLPTLFSTRHLFLLSPPAQDPLARVFFGTDRFATRIEAVENLRKVVPLTPRWAQDA
jgi:heat shock protein HtpX